MSDCQSASRGTWRWQFCGKLSQKEGKHYRLPTEAEWEYACRAGTTTAFRFGDSESKFGEYGWYGSVGAWPMTADKGNSGDRLHDVATRKPNPWHLYDMQGNIDQWCSAYYGPHRGDEIDPEGPKQGNADSDRVLRGGSFLFDPLMCRAASRWHNSPGGSGVSGLRVCVDIDTPTPIVASDTEPAQELPTTTREAPAFTNTLQMTFVRVEPGEFDMGSPPGEPGVSLMSRSIM